MGFFDSLSGASQRRDMRGGSQALYQHQRMAKDKIRDYSGRAKNYLTPYQQQGNQAYTQYTNALGVNGKDAQRGYWDEYQADPQRGYDENRAVDAVNRSMAARGMSRSGYGALAGARAGMDAGRSYTMDRLNRLAGLGQQGYSTAGRLADIDLNTGNALAGIDMAQGQNLQGLGQGLASTRNMGWNNALALGGTLIGGMTPGASGQSAFGNMMTGINYLG